MSATATLTATDRCDRDQAEQASVVVEKTFDWRGVVRLQFCAHHYRALADGLGRNGWKVRADDREEAR